MSTTGRESAVLKTERLLMRELTPEDADDLLDVLGDPVSMRYYPHPFSREEVLAWIDWARGSYAQHGFGLWGLVLMETGELVGDCGLTLQEVEGERLVEVGYHLKRSHWRRGLATEAAGACCRYAFITLGVELVIALVRPENKPSAAVANRIGMREWKPVDHRGIPHLVYRIEREEWLSRDLS